MKHSTTIGNVSSAMLFTTCQFSRVVPADPFESSRADSMGVRVRWRVFSKWRHSTFLRGKKGCQIDWDGLALRPDL